MKEKAGFKFKQVQDIKAVCRNIVGDDCFFVYKQVRISKKGKIIMLLILSSLWNLASAEILPHQTLLNGLEPTNALEREFTEVYDQQKLGVNVFYRAGRHLQLEGVGNYEVVAAYLAQFGLRTIRLADGTTPVVMGISHYSKVKGCGCPSEFSENWVGYFTLESYPAMRSPSAMNVVFSHWSTDNNIRQGVMAAKYGSSNSKIGPVRIGKDLRAAYVSGQNGHPLIIANLGGRNRLPSAELEESNVYLRSLGEISGQAPKFWETKVAKMRHAVTFNPSDAASGDRFWVEPSSTLGAHLLSIQFAPNRWNITDKFDGVWSPALP